MEPFNRKNTVVLIFALSSREQIKHKCIPRGKLLFDKLNNHTLATVKKSGLPYQICSEHHQLGDTFGKRLSTAIQLLFDEGYKNVIAIGNDCPQLTVAHLSYTHEQLSIGNSVLGPTSDKGFYLVGIQKRYFLRAHFEALPWCGDTLLYHTLGYFKTLCAKAICLEELNDIDHVWDIKSVLQSPETFTSTLKNILVLILEQVSRNFFQPVANDFFSFLEIPFNKGSPNSPIYS
ncbi:MAG: DUF2064 domain-containing protein [Bacteroidota bacterium]